jgi:NAD-dependent histone deacetylase SIR2
LYDESHPQGEDISAIITHDLGRKPDMLIILGTTISIPLLSQYIKSFSNAVHSQDGLVVFINKEEVNVKKWHDHLDYFVVGDADEWAIAAARHWRMRRPEDWNESRELDETILSKCSFVQEVTLGVSST